MLIFKLVLILNINIIISSNKFNARSTSVFPISSIGVSRSHYRHHALHIDSQYTANKIARTPNASIHQLLPNRTRIIVLELIYIPNIFAQLVIPNTSMRPVRIISICTCRIIRPIAPKVRKTKCNNRIFIWFIELLLRPYVFNLFTCAYIHTAFQH